MIRSERTLLLLALAVTATPASGQLIPLRVVPIAEADQFGFFPSSNYGMANVSVALRDSLRDPWRNPAHGALVSRARYFGGPTFFSVTNDAGSGQAFPLGAILRVGRTFVGGSLAVQEVAPARPRSQPFFPGPIFSSEIAPFGDPLVNTPRKNRYAHAMAGRVLPGSVSVGASGMWSDLDAVEGTELLFADSRFVRQQGHRSEFRLGASKAWGPRSLEALLLSARQSMAYDAGYSQVFWDPGTRQQQLHAYEVASTWDARVSGAHLQFTTPLGDSTWRLGTVATVNVMRESGAPWYEFMGIPRDPSHTRAFNLGAGLSRRRGPLTLAVDALLEPAWRRATGPADTLVMLTDAANREESYFRFRNGVVRGALAREFAMSGTDNMLRLQAGMELRSVNYDVEQHDRLRGTFRSRANSWREWTHAAGANFVFRSFEFGYHMRLVSGMGRLGVPPDIDGGIVVMDSFIGAAPVSGTTLYPVRVASHQMYVSVPVR